VVLTQTTYLLNHLKPLLCYVKLVILSYGFLHPNKHWLKRLMCFPLQRISSRPNSSTRLSETKWRLASARFSPSNRRRTYTSWITSHLTTNLREAALHNRSTVFSGETGPWPKPEDWPPRSELDSSWREAKLTYPVGSPEVDVAPIYMQHRCILIPRYFAKMN